MSKRAASAAIVNADLPSLAIRPARFTWFALVSSLLPLVMLSGIAGWGIILKRAPENRLAQALARHAAGDSGDLKRAYEDLNLEATRAHAQLLLAVDQLAVADGLTLPPHPADKDLAEREQRVARLRERQQRLYGEALKTLSGCIELAEGSPPAPMPVRIAARLAAVEALAKANQDAEALRVVKDTVRLDPLNLTVFRQAVALYTRSGALYFAGEAAERAARLAPHDPGPKRQLAKLHHYHVVDHDAAIVEYQQALARNPRHESRGEILFGLADCQLRRGKAEAAVRTFELLETEPPLTGAMHRSARMGYAEALANAGRVDLATRLYDELVREHPSDLEIVRAAAHFHVEQGESPRAVEMLEPLYVGHEYRTDLGTVLLRAYRQVGAMDKIDPLAERLKPVQGLLVDLEKLTAAAAGDESDASLRFRAGEVAARLGRIDEARIWFEDALRMRPNYPEVRAALADLPED